MEILPARELLTEPPLRLTATVFPDGLTHFRFDRVDQGMEYPTVNVTFVPASHFHDKGFDRMRAQGPCIDAKEGHEASYVLVPVNTYVEIVTPVEYRRRPGEIESTAISMAVIIFNR